MVTFVPEKLSYMAHSLLGICLINPLQQDKLERSSYE